MKRLWLPLLLLPLAACSADGFSMPSLSLSSLTSMFDGPRPQTRPLAAPLPPAGRPKAGELRSMTVASLTDDSTKTYTVRPYGNGVRVKESTGCTWTRAHDWFSPSDSFADCGTSSEWRTAQAEVRELAPLYPLQVGRVGRYQRRSVSRDGEVSVRDSRCEVTGAVQVIRPNAAPTPAFVVDCDDGRLRRTTWYAPGAGPLAYREIHKRKGVRQAWVRTG